MPYLPMGGAGRPRRGGRHRTPLGWANDYWLGGCRSIASAVRAGRTRRRIIDVAADLFAERSFEGATTREIAARAGVTQPLLNYHFRSKGALWQAAVDSLFEMLATSTLPCRSGRTALNRSEVTTWIRWRRPGSVCAGSWFFSARHPQLHRIISQESKADSDRMDFLVERHIRPLYEATVAMFEQLVAAGRVPPIAPAHLYYILTGAGPTMFVLAPECRRLTGRPHRRVGDRGAR